MTSEERSITPTEKVQSRFVEDDDEEVTIMEVRLLRRGKNGMEMVEWTDVTWEK